MRIAASSLSATTDHQAWRLSDDSVRLRQWAGSPPPAGDAAPAKTRTTQVSVTSTSFELLAEELRARSLRGAPIDAAGRRGRAAAIPAQPAQPQGRGVPAIPAVPATPPGHQRLPTTYTDEQERILTILEKVFGLRIHRIDRIEVAVSAGDPATPTAAGPAGWGLEYDQVHHLEEYERTEVGIAGQVDTADGRSISLDLSLVMERHHLEHSETHLRAGDATPIDPLVMDLTGGGISLDGGTRFRFDLDADGRLESLASLAGGAAFLALDRDGDGAIGSGTELFGPTSGDGFAELARYDGDGNGWIDEGDAVWNDLLVFRPGPDGAYLASLASTGVGALSLDAVASPFSLRDAQNQTLGVVRATSAYLTEQGRVGAVQQVDLVA